MAMKTRKGLKPIRSALVAALAVRHNGYENPKGIETARPSHHPRCRPAGHNGYENPKGIETRPPTGPADARRVTMAMKTRKGLKRPVAFRRGRRPALSQWRRKPERD